jgi:hypothetical protein
MPFCAKSTDTARAWQALRRARKEIEDAQFEVVEAEQIADRSGA